ncbi:hypothetical protein CQW23_08975 [Capsicum baccatum]|uniref:Uncharacterized protein n=1 Tax=Capsicum baccatum TaxID=33114 RepID=A0A2G2XAK5_CAPBA|nr:hypothetical protein CQW23_08975 [Capsicum baccatum]
MEEILAKYNGVPESEPTNENAATAENNQSQRKRSPLKGEMKILRRMLRRLRKKEVDGLTPIDWQPFEDLITEVSLAVKKQKIEDLKRSLASKEVLASDPDTNLHLGPSGESS